MTDLVAQAMLFLVALVVWEIVKFGVDRFLKKSVATDYVTTTQCAGCQNKSDVEEKSVRDSLSELRGIVLVIALKVGISEKDIVKLVKQ